MRLCHWAIVGSVLFTQVACGGPKIASEVIRVRAQHGSEESVSLAVPETMIEGEARCDDRVAALAPGGAAMLSLSWEDGEVHRRVTVRFTEGGQPASYTDLRGGLGNMYTRDQPIPGTAIMLDWANELALVENQDDSGARSAVRLGFQEALVSEVLGRPIEVVERIRELCSASSSDSP